MSWLWVQLDALQLSWVSLRTNPFGSFHWDHTYMEFRHSRNLVMDLQLIHHWFGHATSRFEVYITASLVVPRSSEEMLLNLLRQMVMSIKNLVDQARLQSFILFETEILVNFGKCRNISISWTSYILKILQISVLSAIYPLQSPHHRCIVLYVILVLSFDTKTSEGNFKGIVRLRSAYVWRRGICGSWDHVYWFSLESFYFSQLVCRFPYSNPVKIFTVTTNSYL